MILPKLLVKLSFVRLKALSNTNLEALWQDKRERVSLPVQVCCWKASLLWLSFMAEISIPVISKRGAQDPGGGGGYLGKFLLCMCRWPLRSPTPLYSILWPIIDPILVTFG